LSLRGGAQEAETSKGKKEAKRPGRKEGSMWFSNYRQKLQLLVIVFFTFVAFGAANDAWMPWVRVSYLSLDVTALFVVFVARDLSPQGHRARDLLDGVLILTIALLVAYMRAMSCL
jgi:hypothetical protein